VKPFLEIYADDVKCSHGYSIGKLDDEALYYLMQRGICEKNAKLLLMYAFTNDIVAEIHISDLKKQTIGMINRRLKGELSACDQCILGCTKFEIPELDFSDF
jgi:Fe-S cluster assembly protein SufD